MMCACKHLFLVVFCNQFLLKGQTFPIGHDTFGTDVEQADLRSKVNHQNLRPAVAKCNVAVLISLKNASGLVIQKGIDGVVLPKKHSPVQPEEPSSGQKGIDMVLPSSGQKGIDMVLPSSGQKGIDMVLPSSGQKGIDMVLPSSGHPHEPSSKDIDFAVKFITCLLNPRCAIAVKALLGTVPH
ncbi:putative mucin-2-like [Triplophysa rosa]|uniref:Mucin-2-like n=1 Tax=Triplophysa rosa TaxID=992332 RepID=A0A9W7TDA5_TRIRA|nr:putative mucin-2-like [Triplophysa rosa]